MNKTKIWLIVATSLCVLGITIFVGAMTIMKWDFKKLSTTTYQTNEYQIEQEFKNITIITDTANIKIETLDIEQAKVTCFEEEKLFHSVNVENETLIIELKDNKKWYNHIGINFYTSKITLSLPNVNFENVNVKTSTGNISVERLNSNSAEFSVTTGKVTVKNSNFTKLLNVKVSTGVTNLENITCKNLTTYGNTGDITLKNVIASEKFDIKRTTGDIKFDRSDSYEIKVSTNTGNVKGTLLSEKIFNVETDTGKKQVPNTTSGGICEITTNTGDVIITIA